MSPKDKTVIFYNLSCKILNCWYFKSIKFLKRIMIKRVMQIFLYGIKTVLNFLNKMSCSKNKLHVWSRRNSKSNLIFWDYAPFIHKMHFPMIHMENQSDNVFNRRHSCYSTVIIRFLIIIITCINGKPYFFLRFLFLILNLFFWTILCTRLLETV